MTSSISKFVRSEKREGYYDRLVTDLTGLNDRLNAFSVIDGNMKVGFPLSVKDNLCVKGFECTASSKILRGYIPPFSATVVERALNAGFSFLGKTRMDEFGFGTFGINNDKPVRNPFDERRVAGGSSAGSAVATSIMKYHVSLAESTGGSISAPAAFCGVVGFTPTYGLLSRYGLIDYANSLDKVGVMGRSSQDVRYLFDKVKGYDRRDSTSVDSALKSRETKNLMIVEELLDKVEDRVKTRFLGFLDRLKGNGYSVESVSAKDLEHSIAAYYIISMAEASTNLAKYCGFKYGLKVDDFTKGYNDFFSEARASFGAEAKRRILLGTFVRGKSVRSRYYSRATKIRRAVINRLKALTKKGLLISPTMPVLTPTFEEVEKLTPVQNYAMDILTVPPNLAGMPHVSFPYDYLNGLPLGAQAVSDHFDDYTLLDFVSEWEKGFRYEFKYNLGDL
jgi:aspartyl-tRNA(Asn)/glutamyl-tRNA(Gln) amidotransferase subunit A